ncbi:unnamed protein product, partial [Iphiclides podalirius]
MNSSPEISRTKVDAAAVETITRLPGWPVRAGAHSAHLRHQDPAGTTPLSRDKLSPAFCIASINCTTLGADCHATTTLMIGEAEEKSASSRPEASAAYHHGPLRRSDAVMSRNYFQATA